MKTKMRLSIVLLAFLLISAYVLYAQDECPAFVQSTIQTVNQVCDTLGRDEACYGNDRLEITARTNNLNFTVPGDVADVADIESMQLASMRLEDSVWGVVMMRVRANINPDVSENVTMVLFGDVSITNQVATLVELPALLNTDTAIYSEPNATTSSVTLTNGAPVTANGRLADNSWIRILTADERGYGWVAASALQFSGDVNSLVVVTGDDVFYGPMQAFVLQTGENDRPCAAAPNNGILIQTPQGVGEINFLINEVEVRLGSTGFFSTNDQRLNISVLEGHGEITSEGETEIVETGMFTEVPLNEEGFADGEPSDVEVIEDVSLEELPVEWLPEEVEIEELFDDIESGEISVEDIGNDEAELEIAATDEAELDVVETQEAAPDTAETQEPAEAPSDDYDEGE